MGERMTYFPRHELECPCCHQYRMEPGFVAMLNDIRGRWGVMKVNSACRCTKHNKEVGGEAKSYHLLDLPSRKHGACAADIVVPKERQQEFVDLVHSVYPAVSTIQYPARGFVHLDDRHRVYGAVPYNAIK